MKYLRLFTVPILASFVLFSCSSKTENKEKRSPIQLQVKSKGDLVIAFYYNDSLKENFDFYKREDKLVTVQQKTFESAIKSKTKELEDYIKRNEEKARSGLLSQNEIAQIQQKAQGMEQQLMQYQQAEGERIQVLSVKKLEVISKKIEILGKKYCEENKIDVLLIHGDGGQLNYINASMDVTADFIEFLNENQAEVEKDLK